MNIRHPEGSSGTSEADTNFQKMEAPIKQWKRTRYSKRSKDEFDKTYISVLLMYFFTFPAFVYFLNHFVLSICIIIKLINLLNKFASFIDQLIVHLAIHI
jgi:hypothetical protein